jgi:hypothetical protein
MCTEIGDMTTIEIPGQKCLGYADGQRNPVFVRSKSLATKRHVEHVSANELMAEVCR